MARKIVGPVTGLGALSFGAQSAFDGGDELFAAGDAAIGDFGRPERKQAGQIACAAFASGLDGAVMADAGVKADRFVHGERVCVPRTGRGLLFLKRAQSGVFAGSATRNFKVNRGIEKTYPRH